MLPPYPVQGEAGVLFSPLLGACVPCITLYHTEVLAAWSCSLNSSKWAPFGVRSGFAVTRGTRKATVLLGSILLPSIANLSCSSSSYEACWSSAFCLVKQIRENSFNVSPFIRFPALNELKAPWKKTILNDVMSREGWLKPAQAAFILASPNLFWS